MASDVSASRLVDYKTVMRGYPTFHPRRDVCLDSRGRGRAFLESPKEENEEHGDCLWQAVKVIYGRPEGSRSWQGHFPCVALSEETQQAGFAIRVHDARPAMF